MTIDPARLEELRYEDFKVLATTAGLSPHARIGFPDAYREGHEDNILADLRAKATNLDLRERVIVDIGCGCGSLTQRLIGFCGTRAHRLVLADSAEVLAAVPDSSLLRKSPGRFPGESGAVLASELSGKADVVLAYSVLHYVVLDSNPFDFLDAALGLLAPGGQLLIGDVPNQSMRRRFFSTAAGRAYHRAFTRTDSDPDVVFNAVERNKIDDSVVFGLALRARAAGFDAFLLPQRPDLPMANRREDLLFRRA